MKLLECVVFMLMHQAHYDALIFAGKRNFYLSHVFFANDKPDTHYT